MSTTIYGASDDLIEIEGDISEEFPAYNLHEDAVIGASNGVLLRVRYDDDGVWRLTPIHGADRVTITVAPVDDDDNYSDRAVITDPVGWVVLGTQHARN